MTHLLRTTTLSLVIVPLGIPGEYVIHFLLFWGLCHIACWYSEISA